MVKIADKVFSTINPIVIDMGYELLGIEYVASGKHSVLRLYIDCEKGIGVNDCETVSRQVSSIMDVEDPISGQYNLEVSSPGINRQLFSITDFMLYKGFMVKIKLKSSMNNQKNFIGKIKDIAEEDIKVELDDSEIIINFKNIKKANIQEI